MNKNLKGINIILEINPESIGGAFVFLDKEPKIFYSHRENINCSLIDISFNKYLFFTKRAFNKCLEKLFQQKISNIKNIFVFLSSPWCVTQPRKIIYKRKSSFIFDKKIFFDLLNKETKNFEKKVLQKYEGVKDKKEIKVIPIKHSGINENKMKFIEREIFNINLNGYKIDLSFGKKVKEIEIDTLFSIAPLYFCEIIEEEINKFFRVPIKYHSLLLSLFSNCRNYSNTVDFLIVNVSEEITEVLLVLDDNIEGIFSFPLGSFSLISDVAKKANIGISDIQSLISLYFDNKMKDSLIKNIIEEKIKELKKKWVFSFSKVLGLFGSFFLPEKVYLFVSDKKMLKTFGDFIKSERFAQNLLTLKNFEVNFLKSNQLLSENTYSFYLESLFLQNKKEI